MSENKNKEGSLMSWVKTIILAIILALLIRNFLFNTTLVKGESMQPTLHENDRIICLVFPKYFRNFEQGEIVILDAPDGSDYDYIKRVVGVPGDVIDIRYGQVFINGLEIEESYIHDYVETLTHQETHWELGPDEYFVMGDNRNPGKSLDSRSFGPIKKSQIRSIATLQYYPFSQFGLL